MKFICIITGLSIFSSCKVIETPFSIYDYCTHTDSLCNYKIINDKEIILDTTFYFPNKGWHSKEAISIKLKFNFSKKICFYYSNLKDSACYKLKPKKCILVDINATKIHLQSADYRIIM